MNNKITNKIIPVLPFIKHFLSTISPRTATFLLSPWILIISIPTLPFNIINSFGHGMKNMFWALGNVIFSRQGDILVHKRHESVHYHNMHSNWKCSVTLRLHIMSVQLYLSTLISTVYWNHPRGASVQPTDTHIRLRFLNGCCRSIRPPAGGRRKTT